MFATLTLPAGHDLPAAHRAKTVRVRSANELQSALRQARQNALTLDGTGLDRVLRVDAARGLLEVQAATPWTELVRYLASQKVDLAAFARPDTGLPATVGEAVSQAAAGPDGLPVTAHVVAVTLVTPEGELRRADRDNNPQLLGLALGGWGVVGVLYSVTLQIDSLRRSAAGAVAPVEICIASVNGAAAVCAIECLLPPDQLDGFLEEARGCMDERRISLLGISVRRLLPDASCQLNWATREWAGVAIRFTMKATLGASVGAAEVRRALLEAALARGGSFPLRHAGDATRQQLENCYPALKGFLAEKRRGDAAERLQNGWYRCVTAKLRCEPLESRWGKS